MTDDIYQRGYDMYKIEDVPVKRTRSQYPLGEMAVGQSFLCPPKNNVRSAVSHYGKYHNKKFAVVREGEMFRVGRVA